ncbi:MAG: polyprenyl synthetase family protein [Bdellovibrionales bacterium]|nr:polyprenyl synthetase family protein [Bdellovibrionales bacterium]
MQSAHIEKILTHQLRRSLPNHKVQEVYFYASLPGGKFFRPHLVWAITRDLNPNLYNDTHANMDSNHALLSSAVEFHHTYTLIHDDLPAMDNDLERRGKPCTHIAFGEWPALLAGDGLLNISYQMLSKINHPRSQSLLRFFSWALGPKGLIHGQVMDLAHEMTENFQNTLRTHELKTARLIQVAILGSALIALPEKDSVKEKKLWKFSRLLGVNFQLIDDLSELAETALSEHEKDVNPWLHFTNDSFNETMRGLKNFEALAADLKLANTNKIVTDYYGKMLSIIEPNLGTISTHLNGAVDLSPVVLLMKTFSNI